MGVIKLFSDFIPKDNIFDAGFATKSYPWTFRSKIKARIRMN